jgi:phospholipid transport system substrate-binding protein
MKTKNPAKIVTWLALLMASLVVPTLGSKAMAADSHADDPMVLMRQVTDDVLKNVDANRKLYKKDKSKLYAMVDELILPHVDFRYVAQLALGRNWRGASEDQRTRFTQAFRELLVRNYATALLTYNDPDVKYTASRISTDGRDAVVNSQVTSPKGQSTALTYRLYRNKAGEWKLYDVTAEGVSLVTNYRNGFDREIRQHGLDALIEKIRTQDFKPDSKS